MKLDLIHCKKEPNNQICWEGGFGYIQNMGTCVEKQQDLMAKCYYLLDFSGHILGSLFIWFYLRKVFRMVYLLKNAQYVFQLILC